MGKANKKSLRHSTVPEQQEKAIIVEFLKNLHSSTEGRGIRVNFCLEEGARSVKTETMVLKKFHRTSLGVVLSQASGASRDKTV